MHEIRATIPPEHVAEAARLARDLGIHRVTVSDVYVHGPEARRQVVSVATSTPKARTFLEAFMHSPVLTGTEYSITSRELRAILDGTDFEDLTRPMREPFADVLQDLWQLSHITPSYVARAAAGAILLANGIIDNNPISIIAAALFLPFLAVVLAVALGLSKSDPRLALNGVRALLVSIAVAFAGGAAVAAITGGPILFTGFKGPLASFAISAAIGITAGLSETDDTGRRYLIGVAAAVQLAIFPVWFGAASVIGLPPREVLEGRLLSFLINVGTIAVGAAVGYAALHGPGRWGAAVSRLGNE